MAIQSLLYKKSYKINDSINIIIPTVGEILDNQEMYYGLVSMLTAMPVDMMVQLDDIGIDFTTINEYDLFLIMFAGANFQKDAKGKKIDTSLIFGDLDLSKFRVAENEQNGNLILLDTENDIKIDRAIHGRIADFLRQIHHLEKNIRKPANEDGKKFMLERARAKLKRHKRQNEDSQLESLIVAMVNTEQYKYDFEGTRELSIYQFNESVRQVIKKVDYDNKMYGVYTGSINAKDLSQDDLNWLSHK